MNSAKIYKYLDLSGYGFTGKQAVIELVREFKGYHVPEAAYEFNLIRMQGGIRDLETALVDDWSPIRSDAAIRRFKRLVSRMGNKNSVLNPRSWFSAVGWNYDDRYSGQFFTLSQQYINNLVNETWKTNWPYPRSELSDLELFFRKLSQKLRVKTAFDFEVNLVAPANFHEVTRDYLNKLLSSNVASDTKTIVMHNAFEPFNPQRAFQYFDRAKSIIVDRDPRDNYVAGLGSRPMALPVEKFINRYKIYREVAEKNSHYPDNIMVIQYEDLLTNYENVLVKVLDFLGEEQSIHIHPKNYFDPDVSIKYMGIWRDYEKQYEIELIREELSKYCIDKVDSFYK